MRGKIRHIIFDLGGVLFNLDYSKSLVELEELIGINLHDHINLKQEVINHIAAYNAGNVTTERFIWKFQHLSRGRVPQGQDIIKAWNAMMLGWNPEVFTMLQRLKKSYSLYLLSNINELHFQFYTRSLEPYGGLRWFESLFDKVYYSHHLGLVKPDEKIYDLVLQNHDLDPRQTIFIDDTEENIIAAQEKGLYVVRHNVQASIIEIIDRYLRLS